LFEQRNCEINSTNGGYKSQQNINIHHRYIRPINQKKVERVKTTFSECCQRALFLIAAFPFSTISLITHIMQRISTMP